MTPQPYATMSTQRSRNTRYAKMTDFRSYAPHKTSMIIDGLKVSEAATELKMHPETVRRLVREGRIKAAGRKPGIGHPIVITHEEIERIKKDGIDYSTTRA